MIRDFIKNKKTLFYCLKNFYKQITNYSYTFLLEIRTLIEFILVFSPILEGVSNTL